MKAGDHIPVREMLVRDKAVIREECIRLCDRLRFNGI